MKQPKLSTHQKPTKQKQNTHKDIRSYLHISNEQFLRRNLLLLGATQASFQKQTKMSIEAEYFVKNLINPTSTKQFFYILYFCLQKLCTYEQFSGLQMWYPPRNISQQLQFKKSTYKLIQQLEILGRIPKNIIISKGVIMGDTSNQSLTDFLRFLSEMSLRHQYIQQFSQQQRLVQICCNSSTKLQNEINRFYIYPFVPSNGNIFEHTNIDLQQIRNNFQLHLKVYLRKLARLRTKSFSPVLSEQYQELMRDYAEQKQINDTMIKRIPAPLLGENRAFDRRRLMDRHFQIWEDLGQLKCNFMDQEQLPILKLEGEIDLMLQKWQPIKGVTSIIEANTLMKNIKKLKTKAAEADEKFKALCIKIQAKIKNI